MKNVIPVFLGILLAVVIAALFFVKSADKTQIASLNTSLTDCSNRLDTATAQITARDSEILSLSNNLAAASAATSDVSNQLIQAQATVGAQKQEANKLNAQLTDLGSQDDALNRSLADATNQLAALNQLQVATKSSLEQTNGSLVQLQNDYGVLGQRLRQSVAAQLVLERKWRIPSALQEQVDYLKYSPEEIITPESIYAGLNVEVSSNGKVRIISPE